MDSLTEATEVITVEEVAEEAEALADSDKSLIT